MFLMFCPFDILDIEFGNWCWTHMSIYLIENVNFEQKTIRQTMELDFVIFIRIVTLNVI